MAQHRPTSRKKHYLQAEIDPKWLLDIDFIPSFIKHIGHRVRDVFIPNARRIGTFCIQNQQLADKLCSSFNSGNYSCRGRKPKAQKLTISATVFCIQLRNVNHAINGHQFHEWIRSLNATAFDIKLHAVEILEPSTTCILSFDSIETAISIKVQSQQQHAKFRNVAIHFTHWYVPRRSAYPEAALTDENSSSAASSCTTSTSSASGSGSGGPLYLTDSSIPPPPQRSAPPPPLPLHLHDEKSGSGDADDDVHTMSVKTEQQHQIIEELSRQHECMLNELDKQKNFGQQMHANYNFLYGKYVKMLNLNTMLLWSAEEVTQWIINLENGRFAKYKEALLHSMNMENVNGSMLITLAHADLYRLGVDDSDDQQVIVNHIRALLID